MDTFGQRMKQAVEDRGLKLEDVAEATGLEVDELQALECDDFGALPSEDVVRRGLHSFAQLVEVDPDQVIADFSQERQRTAPRAMAAPPMPEARRVPRPAIAVMIILAAASVLSLFWPRQAATAPAPASSQNAAAAQTSAPVRETSARSINTAPAPRTPVAPPRSPEPRTSPPAIQQPITPGASIISRQGVGTGIVDHALTGASTQFSEGDRVYFWNKIEDGTPGEKIEHVWLRDGVAELRVPLIVGGQSWRTHSYKILNPGSAGSWAVEVRDASGRVLARSEFACSPRPTGF